MTPQVKPNTNKNRLIGMAKALNRLFLSLSYSNKMFSTVLDISKASFRLLMYAFSIKCKSLEVLGNVIGRSLLITKSPM